MSASQRAHLPCIVDRRAAVVAWLARGVCVQAAERTQLGCILLLLLLHPVVGCSCGCPARLCLRHMHVQPLVRHACIASTQRRAAAWRPGSVACSALARRQVARAQGQHSHQQGVSAHGWLFADGCTSDTAAVAPLGVAGADDMSAPVQRVVLCCSAARQPWRARHGSGALLRARCMCRLCFWPCATSCMGAGAGQCLFGIGTQLAMRPPLCAARVLPPPACLGAPAPPGFGCVQSPERGLCPAQRCAGMGAWLLGHAWRQCCSAMCVYLCRCHACADTTYKSTTMGHRRRLPRQQAPGVFVLRVRAACL